MKRRQLFTIAVFCLCFISTPIFSQNIGDQDVQVCHATNSNSNPYNLNIVDANSIVNNPNGHAYHEDDIIPPFDYDGGSFPGLNWTVQNIAIWENGCAIPQTITLAVKVLLQGPYNTVSKDMNVNITDLLPLTEPYSNLDLIVGTDFQNIGASTTLATLVDYNIVDWAMVEIRTANKTSMTRVGLVTKTGDLVDIDGISPITFTNAPADDYYVITHHRNHLSVSTATPLSLANDPY